MCRFFIGVKVMATPLKIFGSCSDNNRNIGALFSTVKHFTCKTDSQEITSNQKRFKRFYLPDHFKSKDGWQFHIKPNIYFAFFA